MPEDYERFLKSTQEIRQRARYRAFVTAVRELEGEDRQLRALVKEMAAADGGLLAKREALRRRARDVLLAYLEEREG